MSDNKTKPTKKSVEEYINKIKDEQKRDDAKKLLKIMKETTGEKPVMWGDSIVGFGKYHYKYASGRERDYFKVGFSQRSKNLTIYLMMGFDKHRQLLQKLGKHKTSVSCLYINNLDDVDSTVLKNLIKTSYHSISKNPS